MTTRFSVLFGCSLLLVSAAAIQAARKQTDRPAKPQPAQPEGARSGEPPKSGEATPATPAFDEKKALTELRKQIAGKETDPAEKVFMDVDVLKGFPAGQFLAIMEKGFSRSLGVTCTHCHVPEKWQASDKRQKQAAREMWRLVGTLNNELLPKVKGLDPDHKPIVNCTTCHRGQIKPALNLE
jgi:hypothetical protein